MTKKDREQYDVSRSDVHSWVHREAAKLAEEEGGLVSDAQWIRCYVRARDAWERKVRDDEMLT